MTALTLAKPDDLERLSRLVADCQTEQGLTQSEAERQAALAPLLEGAPHGAIYLIGPARAPIGYVAVSFGWSLALGGLDAVIDDLYIRASVRGRGIGAEILGSLPRALSAAGLKALHVRVDPDDSATLEFYTKALFSHNARPLLLTRRLRPPI